MIERIVYSTDFSPEGIAAFEHALALALAYRAQLDLLHIHALDVAKDFNRFPSVRKTLAKWNVVPADIAKGDVAAHAGVKVNKVEVRDVDAVEGLTTYLNRSRPQLLVMASHARGAFGRLLRGSISAEVTHDTQLPTLLIGPKARSFVNSATGAIRLRHILLPVDHEPAPEHAVNQAAAMLKRFDAVLDILHIGPAAPPALHYEGKAHQVRVLPGDPVEQIVAQATAADLVVMPTQGRRGVLDRIRGSTADRVLHEAPCPVLVIPVRSRQD